MNLRPLTQHHGIQFLRENELALLRALTQRSTYGHNITKLSEYQDIGSHPGAMRLAAYVLKELKFLEIIYRGSELYMRLNFSFASEAVRALEGVQYGFKPGERDIVTLITLITRFGRSITNEDAPTILCTRGGSLRFYMRKSKLMSYHAGANRGYRYETTKLGEVYGNGWLEFTRVFIRNTFVAEPKTAKRTRKVQPAAQASTQIH